MTKMAVLILFASNSEKYKVKIMMVSVMHADYRRNNKTFPEVT